MSYDDENVMMSHPLFYGKNTMMIWSFYDVIVWWWSGKGNDDQADLDKDLKGHLMRHDGEEPVDEPDARDRCQKYKPEVEKYVDLQTENYK